jgi:5-deoxy-glucuronate isomerase
MTPELKQNPITPETCFVPKTHEGKGRRTAVKPGDTAARFLHYGRITLDAGDAAEKFSSGDHEIGLICLKGGAKVTADGKHFNWRNTTRFTSRAIPRSRLSLARRAVISLKFQRRLRSVIRSSLFRTKRCVTTRGFTSSPASLRRNEISTSLIGANVEAGRIMAGVTFSTPGNWTSWPPHEHSKLLEEAYLFIDMPSPSFGVQFVYTDPQKPELVQVVREGDCVLMPQGYHPNVAAPGGQINFLWMMAAIREGEDRLYGVVNVQPEYAAGGSGLEAVSDKK